MKDCRQFYIDGKWVNPAKAHDFEVINPANEEPIATISLGSAADVDKAVAAAKRAFESYSETTVEERLALLRRIIEIYKAKSEEMAETISQEMGCAHLTVTSGAGSRGAGTFVRNRAKCWSISSSRNSRARRSCGKSRLGCAD